MGDFRGRAVIRKVYYGEDLDDEDIEDERERDRRGGKYCDAWIDDQANISTNIPIARKVARSLFVGDFQGRPEIMPRGWYEGDEKKGIEITEVDWGDVETNEFTFSGALSADGDENELEFEVDDKIMLVRLRARGKSATGTEIDLHLKNAAGDFVEILAWIEFDSPRGETDLIAKIVKPGQAMAPKVEWAGGARNVVLHVDYVRLG